MKVSQGPSSPLLRIPPPSCSRVIIGSGGRRYSLERLHADHAYVQTHPFVTITNSGDCSTPKSRNSARIGLRDTPSSD